MSWLKKLSDATDSVGGWFADKGSDIKHGTTNFVGGLWGMSYNVSTAGDNAAVSNLTKITSEVKRNEQALQTTTAGAAQVTEATLGPLMVPYRKLVDQPVATAFTAASLANSETYLGRKPGFFDSSFFSPKTWQDAYHLTERNHITAGNGVANIFTNDILDEQEYEKFHKGKLADFISIPIDVAAPFKYDPLLLGAAGVNTARLARLKPLRVEDDLEAIARSQRVQKVVEHVGELAAKPGAEAKIKDRYYREDPRGADLAHLLANAENNIIRTKIIQVGMGDLKALNELQNMDLPASQALRRVMGDREALYASGYSPHPTGPDGQGILFHNEEEFAKLNAEAEQLYKLEDRAVRLQRVQGMIVNQPLKSIAGDARFEIIRSDFYQSKLGTPLRVVHQRRPHGEVRLDAPNSDIELDRIGRAAKLPTEVTDGYRSRYMATQNVGERAQIATELREKAIATILTRHGLSAADTERVLAGARTSYAEQEALFAQRKFDGENRAKVQLTTEAGLTEIPLHYSQLDQVVLMPDMREVEKVAKRLGPLSRTRTNFGDQGAEGIGTLVDAAEDLLGGFNRVWKAGALIRAAYPMRVAAGEEQLRQIALFGAMARMKYVKGSPRRVLANRRGRRETFDNYVREIESAKGRPLNDVEKRRYRKQAFYEFNALDKIAGPEDFVAAGLPVPPPLKGRGARYRSEIDSASAFDLTLHAEVEKNLASLDRELRGYSLTGKYESMQWVDNDPKAQAEWLNGWLNAGNKHLGIEPVNRMLIEQHLGAHGIVRYTQTAKHVDRAKADLYGEMNLPIVDWLFSAEGAAYRRGMPQHHMSTPDTIRDWLANKRGQIESYLPTPALKEAALESRLTPLLAEREFSALGEGSRPIVHGESLAALSDNPVSRVWNKIIGEGYNYTARLPSNVLARNPAFHHAYYAEASRRIELLSAQKRKLDGDTFSVTQKEIDDIADASREVALRDLKKNFYDLREQSDLGHSLRFVMPFYNAWTEAISVWSRIVIQRPRTVVDLHNLWQSPDRAGMTYTDPNSGDVSLLIPVPGFLKNDKFFGGALKTVDEFRLGKNGLNMILTGLPGMGPVGALPVYELTKNRPELAENDALKKFFLGGRIPQGFSEAVFPTTWKNFVKANAAEDSRTFTRYYWSIYMTRLREVQQGVRDEDELDPAQIAKEAHGLAAFKMFAQFVAPSSLSFQTPMQPYIDIRRNMMKEDPEHGDDKFIATYGEELIALTTSMSRSTNGVPPTLEGWAAAKEHEALLQEHPELGSLIIGQIGGELAQGEYSANVYELQLRQQRAPGDPTKQRELLTVDELVKQPDINLGWREYDKLMTVLDTELERRGLSNYQQKDASDIVAIKRAALDPNNPNSIAAKHPSWWETYNVTDRLKWTKRISALEDIVYRDEFDDRDDMTGIREYLAARKVIQAELGRRESKTLDAVGNKDVATVWDGLRQSLVLRNPAFARVFYRLLENDQVEAN
jgi:hypothetical protein